MTIIIPCFNHQEFLSDAIESALSQTVTCEIIFIDDGSTDHSLEIAAKYPIKIVRQVNKGLSSARNTGIMNATGDYILPLDADDIILPDAVEILEKTIKKTNADVVSPSFKCFGVNNREVVLDENVNIDSMKSINQLPYFSATRRSALLEVGGYSSKMIWGYEDWHLWINLLSVGKKFVTIKDILLLYRTKDISMYSEALKHDTELKEQINKDFNA